MNLSKREQHVRHHLALGGHIRHEVQGKRITAITCFTHDGAVLSDCDLPLFQRLRRRGLIGAQGGNTG